MENYIVIGAYCFVGLIFVGGALLVSKLVSFTSSPSKNKHTPYECGIEAFGDAKIQFKIAYFIYALIFLIFDIEALFLFPCMKIFRSVIDKKSIEILNHQAITIPSSVLFWEVSVFLFILTFGLLYAWKKGVLKWD